jgi:hypothetical protein
VFPINSENLPIYRHRSFLFGKILGVQLFLGASKSSLLAHGSTMYDAEEKFRFLVWELQGSCKEICIFPELQTCRITSDLLLSFVFVDVK